MAGYSELKPKSIVILRKSYRKAVIEKVYPKDKSLFIVSYYNDINKLCYDVIGEHDIISPEDYEKIKNRINKINSIYED
jgi:hypothetical protein